MISSLFSKPISLNVKVNRNNEPATLIAITPTFCALNASKEIALRTPMNTVNTPNTTMPFRRSFLFNKPAILNAIASNKIEAANFRAIFPILSTDFIFFPNFVVIAVIAAIKTVIRPMTTVPLIMSSLCIIFIIIRAIPN